MAALNRHRRFDDGYRGFVEAGGQAHRRGGRQRTQLPGPAAACRGAGRTRPGQDHVLLQRQPRVPHPAHLILGPSTSCCARRPSTSSTPGTGAHPAQRVAAGQIGQHSAGFLAHPGGTHAGPLRACRPVPLDRRAGQRLPLGDRSGRPDLHRGLPAAGPNRSISTARCGRRWCSTCCPTR